MKKTMVSQPLYFKKFLCTCDKCVYNCCHHGWQIRIDKNTYNKYKKLGNETGKELLDKIKLISESPFIAIIVPNDNKSCFFLDEKGFCSIQLKLGYDYLSRTCRIHPRSISFIEGMFETYLELSCEEAVKVVLFEQEPMSFEEAVLEPDGCGNIIPNRMLTAEKYTSSKNGVKIFNTLRKAAARIIQSRMFSLRVRMLLLCILIEQVNQLLLEKQDSEIIKAADDFLGMIDAGTYDSIAEQMPGGIEIDYNITIDILRDMAKTDDKRFSGILSQSLEALGISPDSNDLPSSFAHDYKEFYKKFFSDKEYIFENYIVNHIFMEGFPFNYGKESGVMANFADLLAKYNLIELMLVGYSAYHKKFDQWNVINCVSAFARCYDHALKGYLVME